jgi:hypothetical protein
MNTRTILGLALVASAACAPTTGGAGSSSAADMHDRASTDASVSGTTLDARSGEPLSSVEVTGPGNARARSDAKGRFLLSGLVVGATGTVEARASDGRKASVTLLPLASGRLEVVLHLR